MNHNNITKFLSDNKNLPTPFLLVDTKIVEDNYIKLKSYLPKSNIYYAVKANPAKQVLQTLDRQGCYFDVASLEEVDLCLSLGINSNKLSLGNTIKKNSTILSAYNKGVKIFAFDSIEELIKISESAPGSKVLCRIIVENKNAEWPLSKKFGCDHNMAIDLLVKARELNLKPEGISFHVGSQQTVVASWKKAFSKVKNIYTALKKHDIKLNTINVGGGFPAFNYYYSHKLPALDEYTSKIKFYHNNYFGDENVELIFEPGRYIAGDAGVIRSEVILVSSKSKKFKRKWVYLDIGVFGGLIETLDESIKYKIMAEHNNELMMNDSKNTNSMPVYLAGPTCDSMDIMYQKTKYYLPSNLKSGDKVLIWSTGAYTSSYSSVAFNGFPPLKEYYI